MINDFGFLFNKLSGNFADIHFTPETKGWRKQNNIHQVN